MLRLRDAASLRESVEQLLQSKSVLSGDRLSLRISRPSEQIPLLMNQLGDRILGLELTRPSLEDVFLELTGRSLASSEAPDA